MTEKDCYCYNGLENVNKYNTSFNLHLLPVTNNGLSASNFLLQNGMLHSKEKNVQGR